MEETDHETLHRELEDQGDEMERRRDELEGEADTARQDIRSKVSDSDAPGAQDEHEEVIYGREAVEEQDSEEEEGTEEEGSEEEEAGEEKSDDADGAESDEGGGGEGAGYREDEE